MGATVECNPRFGPAAFETAIKYSKGEKIPPIMTNVDNFYDSSNAAASIAGSY
jgi:galactofuranose transport system substrate-binding protein